MPEFLTTPIKAFKWKRLFQGLNAIRPDVANLFYKGDINEKEQYTEVKGRRVDFVPEAINVLYGLDDNEIGHVIFKDLKECDIQEALENVAWPETKWDRTQNGKY
uniref:Uncharacterized protein n=1 Tax=Cucumis melo TaxID=3656 RepID=A0A9I9D959_CUCME